MIRFRAAKPVIVQRLFTSQNELGEAIENWQDISTIMAEIWPLQGNKTRGEMGVTEKSTHKLFTTGAIESNTRVVDGANTYLVGYIADWCTHREAMLERV